MRFTFNIRPIRVLVAFFACAFLMLSNVYPAMAIGSTQSRPTEGEANLTAIERNSQKVLQGGPKSPEELNQQSPGAGGINEVQGTADINKMKNPANSRGTTFQEQVEKALDKAAD